MIYIQGSHIVAELQPQIFIYPEYNGLNPWLSNAEVAQHSDTDNTHLLLDMFFILRRSGWHS